MGSPLAKMNSMKERRRWQVAGILGTVFVPFYERGCQEKVFPLGSPAEGNSSLGIQPLIKLVRLSRSTPDRNLGGQPWERRAQRRVVSGERESRRSGKVESGKSKLENRNSKMAAGSADFLPLEVCGSYFRTSWN